MSSPPRVLIVEDDDAIRALLAAALRREALDVDQARDGADAIALTQTCDYAVIVLDLMMPRLNGFEFLEAFAAGHRPNHTAIFVISAFDDTHLRALDPKQVRAIIRKPFDVPQLIAMICEVALLPNAQSDCTRLTPAGDQSDDAMKGQQPN